MTVTGREDPAPGVVAGTARPKAWKERVARWNRLFSLWFFGDVAYAILPIATLAFIKIVVGSSFGGFFVLKEWTFATIVFFGVTIRRLIRLNADTPLSYKLDSGVQLFIFLLITAVVTLSFVMLTELDEWAGVNLNVLATSQMALFVGGLVALGFVTVSEERLRLKRAQLPRSMGKTWLLRQITVQFDRAYDAVGYITFAVNRARELRDDQRPNDEREWREQEKRKRDLISAVALLEELVAETRSNVEALVENR